MIDQELFNLCREVFEKTGWGWESGSPLTHNWYLPHGKAIRAYAAKHHQPQDHEAQLPLYTSDYLLENLPEEIFNEEFEYYWRFTMKKGLGGYIVDYENRMWVRDHKSSLTSRGIEHESMQSWKEPIYSDTPLKALLKLWLALHEAGELK